MSPDISANKRRRVRFDAANLAALHTIKRASHVRRKSAGGTVRVGLTRAEYQILLAVIAHTATFSKLEDRCATTGLADVVGWGGSYRSRSARVRRALQALADADLIVYRPGTSIADLPTIGLKPHLPEDGVCNRNPICFRIQTPSDPGSKPHPGEDGNQGFITKGYQGRYAPKDEPRPTRVRDGKVERFYEGSGWI